MKPPIIVNCDDNEPSRYARNRILRGAGFEVHDASTGRSTIELVKEQTPDLVLLDVHLPDMYGIDVCQRIRTMPGGASIIVVQISASALTANHAIEALDSGADAYIVEPVDPAVLVATVRAMLRLRSAEQALQVANDKLEAVNRDLQRSNEDLEQFAFAASHDLQEPLRTVTTFLQLIQEQTTSVLNDEQKQYLSQILAAAVRMRNLIRDVLAFSQVGREDSSSRAVSLGEALSLALENLEESIVSSKAEVVIGSPLPVVWGNQVLLSQLLQNLIGNSIKYRRPQQEPCIRLSAAYPDAGMVRIDVQDNGIGIDARYLDRIFSPFQRLHGQEIPGTGIGLAACRRIVDVHGGKIWVESEPNVGSTFSFSLRLVPTA